MSRPDDSDFGHLTRDLARELGSRRVVALGAPRPQRLANAARDLDLVALDRRERAGELSRVAPDAEVHEWDPAAGEPLPVPATTLRDAIVVCDGLLETLDDPAPLVARLADALAEAPAAIVVTADRELVRRGAPVDARLTGEELCEQLASAGLDVAWLGIASATWDATERSSSVAVVAGRAGERLGEVLETGARNLGFDPGAALEGGGREPTPLRICIASYEFVGPTKTGGIGTAYTSLAEALAEAGHEVTVLYLGQRGPRDERTPFSHWVDHYTRKGIELVELPESELPRIYFGHFEAKRSYLAYLWLAERDRERPFDVIHFPETLGHGYYSVLAKRQGWAFDAATIAIGIHSSTYWVMETNRAPYLTGQEFAADFLERASVALGDVVISPSAYMVDWMLGKRWSLPERIFVQQYIRSRVVADAAESAEGEHGRIDEVVFFGRLETRKGLPVFCDALDLLAAGGAIPDVSIAFMGKQAAIDGERAERYIKRRAREGEWPWEWCILDDFGQPEAVAYLRGNGVRRLAVMPSLADNTPNTVMEALALRIPFIASRVGGTAELIHPLDLGRSTFDPRGRGGDADLAAALREAVEATDFRPPRPAVHSAPNEQVHLRWHEGVARAARVREAKEAESAVASVAAVFVADDEERLSEAVESLEAQDHPSLEVVVVADGDGHPALQSELERRDAAFAERGWKRLADRRSGRPDILNRGAAETSADYLLFLGDNAVLEPGAVSALARVAGRTGADVVSAAARWSVREGDGIRPPEGGPAVAGLFYRCFGDNGYLIRREAFEALGGFDPTADPGMEDHHLLCRASLDGRRIEVVPEPLVRERIADENPAEAIHSRPGAVLGAFEQRAHDGLAQLPQVAQAQWALAGSKEAQIQGILEGRSWRVTRPLRWVTGKLGRSRPG